MLKFVLLSVDGSISMPISIFFFISSSILLIKWFGFQNLLLNFSPFSSYYDFCLNTIYYFSIILFICFKIQLCFFFLLF